MGDSTKSSTPSVGLEKLGKNGTEGEKSRRGRKCQVIRQGSRKEWNDEAFNSLVASIPKISSWLSQVTSEDLRHRNAVFSPLSNALMLTIQKVAEAEQLREVCSKDSFRSGARFVAGIDGDSCTLMSSFKRILERCPLGFYDGLQLEMQNEICAKPMSVSNKFQKVLKALDCEVNQTQEIPDDGVLLTSTMNFHGDWHPGIEFDADLTRLELFCLSHSKRCRVHMMQTSSMLTEYADLPDMDAHAVSLRYDHPSLALVVILPKNRNGGWGGVKTLEDKIRLSQLTPSSLSSKFAAFSSTRVVLKLPRFQIHSEIDFHQDEVAEPSSEAEIERTSQRMKCIHKAIIEVDEGVPKKVSCLKRFPERSNGGGKKPIYFTVDHPFIFYLVDKESSVLLMSGRVCDPSISPSTSSSTTTPTPTSNCSETKSSTENIPATGSSCPMNQSRVTVLKSSS